MPNKSLFKSHEDYLNWYRNYREENRIKIRIYNRKYNKEWRKENGYNNEQNWRDKNIDKAKAQRLLQIAVKTGKVKKQNCKECGSDKNIQGHHEDYTKPLEVLWLCPLCHKRLHITKLMH